MFSRKLVKELSPWIWLSPVCGMLFIVLVYPWAWSLVLSLTDWSPILTRVYRFIGLDNYIDVFTDPLFHKSLWNTFYLVSVSVSSQLLLGLGIALFLDTRIRGAGLFVTLLATPLMFTPAAVGLMMKFLFHNEFGLINYFLEVVGLPEIRWLSDTRLTMPVIIGIQVWQHTPFSILILYAGLKAIPQGLKEAAAVDGANYWQRFWYIILPILAPLITLILLFRTIFELRTFDTIFALFQSGGPGNAALVLGTYLYQVFSQSYKIGLSSAIAYVILLITILFTYFFIWDMYRSTEKGNE